MHLAPAVGPEAVEAYLRSGDYDAFNIGLEDGSHVGIPHIVRGDFSLFTAPYGMCVFFLVVLCGFLGSRLVNLLTHHHLNL